MYIVYEVMLLRMHFVVEFCRQKQLCVSFAWFVWSAKLCCFDFE